MSPRSSLSVAIGILLAFAFAAFCPAQDVEKKSQPKEEQTKTVEGTWAFVFRTHLSSEMILLTFSKKGKNFVATIDFPELRLEQKFAFVTTKDDTVEIKEYGLNPVFEAKMSGDKKMLLEGKMLFGNVWRPMT